MGFREILSSEWPPSHAKALEDAIQAGHQLDLFYIAVGCLFSRIQKKKKRKQKWEEQSKFLVSMRFGEPELRLSAEGVANISIFGFDNPTRIQNGWRIDAVEGTDIPLQCMDVKSFEIDYAALFTQTATFDPVQAFLSPVRQLFKSARRVGIEHLSFLFLAEQLQGLNVEHEPGSEVPMEEDDILIFKPQFALENYPVLGEELVGACGVALAADKIARDYGV